MDSRDEERFLLSSVFVGGAATYWNAAAVVEAEHFESRAHQAIWRAFGRVAEESDPNWVLVWGAIEPSERPFVKEQGGEAFLHTLATAPVSRLVAVRHAKNVRQLAYDRAVRRLVNQAAESEGSIDVDSLIAALDDLRKPETGDVLMRDALQEVYLKAEAAKPIKAFTYPWQEIQMGTRGLRPGWLCVWAGETGHGKTATALSVTLSVLNQGGTVLYDSLEMGAEELAIRLAQQEGASSMRLLSNTAGPEEFNALSKLIGDDRMQRFRVERAYRVEQLPGLITRWKPNLLVVDHLGKLDIGRLSRLEGTTRNSWYLKALALKFDIPVLCLHQLSRPQEHKRSGDKPTLNRLRDSGAVEQDADTVCFVWRKREETGELSRMGQFIIAKSRMGNTGALDFTFDGARQTFTPLDGRHS